MKRKPRGRPPDPDEDWNREELSVQEGRDMCKQLYDKIEDAPSAVWDKAFEFFESIQKKVGSIRETIESNNRFTEGQKSALTNMEAGVDRWIEKDE